MLGVSSCASLRRFVVGHALQLRVARQRAVVGQEAELQPARQRDQFGVDLVDLGKLVVEHEQADVALLAQQVEGLEPAPGPASLHIVGRVGEALDFVEHEPGNHEIATQYTGARERQQLAVHHDRRVDEQTVTSIEGLGPNERAGRKAEELEHRFALAGDESVTDVAEDPRRQTDQRNRDRDRDEQCGRQHQYECERGTGDGAERARHEPGRGAAIDPAFDDAQGLVEDPAEDAAADVAEQAAQHAAEALSLGTKGTGRPKAGRSPENHDEETNAFYEHPFLHRRRRRRLDGQERLRATLKSRRC